MMLGGFVGISWIIAQTWTGGLPLSDVLAGRRIWQVTALRMIGRRMELVSQSMVALDGSLLFCGWCRRASTERLLRIRVELDECATGVPLKRTHTQALALARTNTEAPSGALPRAHCGNTVRPRGKSETV